MSKFKWSYKKHITIVFTSLLFISIIAGGCASKHLTTETEISANVSEVSSEAPVADGLSVQNPQVMWADLLYLPAPLASYDAKRSATVLPYLQQYKYMSSDNKIRIVFEVSKPSLNKGNYNRIDDVKLDTPQDGDTVLEWNQDDMNCRIFGNFTKEELQKAADNALYHGTQD